jgi:hypothetical protein
MQHMIPRVMLDEGERRRLNFVIPLRVVHRKALCIGKRVA